MKPPRVLIIAGSDSGGGAGIQADIRTVTMFGGHPMTAITAITAQNSVGVQKVMAVPTAMVIDQMDSVIADLGVDSTKIGMIGSAETALALAERLETLGDVPIVLDPVMVATSGAALADAGTIAALERLARQAVVITPNLPELAALTADLVAAPADTGEAALALARSTGTAVLAKGGHGLGETLVDLLVWPDGAVRCWTSQRIDTPHTHGTGCTLAAAIACGLGAGQSLERSVDQARAYVRLAIGAAPGFGGGNGPMGHSLGAIPWQTIHRIVE